MRFAISNISLPARNHYDEMRRLRDIGFQALEIAPSKIWEDTHRISFAQVEGFRKQVEEAGLAIVGLHSLFFDQPGLGLFRGGEIRKKTLSFLVHLSKLCSDVGGKTLVYGSPKARQRNDLSVQDADEEAVAFFSELCEAVEAHGTCFMIEALGKSETDYVNSVLHALQITTEVNRRELRCHIDAKSVTEAGEATAAVFGKAGPMLAHYHANDPGLGVLGYTGEVDHARLGHLLRRIGYRGYVSAEQRLLDFDDPYAAIRQSYALMERCYG